MGGEVVAGGVEDTEVMLTVPPGGWTRENGRPRWRLHVLPRVDRQKNCIKCSRRFDVIKHNNK